MRGSRLVAAAVVLIIGALFGTACSTTQSETKSVQPSMADKQAAIAFLKTAPTDKVPHEPSDWHWVRAVMLSKDFVCCTVSTWSAVVQRDDGKTVTLTDDGGRPDLLNKVADKGSYIAYVDDGDTQVRDDQLVELAALAVDIKGEQPSGKG